MKVTCNWCGSSVEEKTCRSHTNEKGGKTFSYLCKKCYPIVKKVLP